MAPLPLAGASVLIAGATGGLGRALAAECARRGARLTLVGRDAARLTELGAAHPEATTVSLDLRAPEACTEAVAAAVSAHGTVDVVIDAAGVVAFGPVAELDVDTMEELFLTNVFLPMMLSRAALAAMAPAGRGAIVNISGVIAEQNLPGMAAYGASKAALRSFDEALAREARRVGVRVIDARPPHTETGLATRPIAGSAPRMPTGLSPEQVARTICDAVEQGTDDLPSSAFAGH